MANRLAKETSPYLLQHQNNPVDWYPWGDEALSRAKREDKPILLSIGYSACHWCHVMEHESFENAEIAQLMNQWFINIKVDREERPDLDQIYQNVAQAMTGGGGWPLTVFLTPELKPFFGGTYFPPEDRYGRPGLGRVLMALAEAYENERESIQSNADRLMSYISQVEEIKPGQAYSPKKEDLHDAVEALLGQLDWVHGGMGGAPKFPQAMIFEFLWRWGVLTRDERAQEAVKLSLREMARGGIYDQLGGGFHRYSVDATWSVPHFEKMLYDQALLLKLYSQVYLSAAGGLAPEDQALYGEVIEQTVEYVFREMTSEEGLFYSTQDADSEGEEGKFFVWDPSELKALLTEKEFHVFTRFFGVSDAGNFEHGKTVLFRDQSVEALAQSLELPHDEVRELLKKASHRLVEVRHQRVHPALDSKVLTGWNALMISGLVWASRVLKTQGKPQKAEQCLRRALHAFEVLIQKVSLSEEGARLASTYQNGQPKHAAYLDDYAYLVQAALELSRSVSESESVAHFLQKATLWMDTILKHFKDSQSVGYFFTADDHEALIQRPKTLFDQAIPSGAAVVLECLGVLAVLSEGERAAQYEAELAHQIQLTFQKMKSSPYGSGQYLSSVLQAQMGVLTLQGLGACEWMERFFIYQRPSEKHSSSPSLRESAIVACHQRVCSLPFHEPSELNAWMTQRWTL